MGELAFTRRERAEHLYRAANNGTIGGGKAILLRIPEAFRIMGADGTVVAPAPSSVVVAAEHAGPDTAGIDPRGRLAWALG